MDNLGNVKKEYKILKKDIDEVVLEISTVTENITDFSKLLLFEKRLRELDRKLDCQSDKALRVRENGGPTSEYHPQVKNIKEDRLLIAKSMNEIATRIDLELKKHANICLPKEERSFDQPILKFPDFKGDSLSYLKFKNEFLIVMEFVSLSDEIKAIYLKKSLKYKTYVFIHKSYDEIWKWLDERYNNKWTLSIESLNDLFSVQKPKDEIYEIEHYWDTAINKLRNILYLEMNTETILMHHIICSLPMQFRNNFRMWLPYDILITKMLNINKANEAFYKVIHSVQSVNTDLNNNDSCTQVSDDQNDSDEGKGDFPFPEFHGDMLTYESFKRNFMDIGVIYGMSDKLKLHHLKLSLKDDALRYIGSWGSHHESYKNMWKYLDKRYNDLWMISNKMVKDFFNMQQPMNEQFEISSYWITAISDLRSMLSQELNLENIFGIYIMQSLPRAFQLELIKKLQCNEKEKKLYGLDELLDSYNNVMSLQKSLYITHDSTTSNVNRKGTGHRKFHGSYRGSGRGRACKRYD